MEANKTIISDIGFIVRAGLEEFHADCCRTSSPDKETSDILWAAIDSLIKYYEDALDPDLINRCDGTTVTAITKKIIERIISVVEIITDPL